MCTHSAVCSQSVLIPTWMPEGVPDNNERLKKPLLVLCRSETSGSPSITSGRGMLAILLAALRAARAGDGAADVAPSDALSDAAAATLATLVEASVSGRGRAAMLAVFTSGVLLHHSLFGLLAEALRRLSCSFSHKLMNTL